MKKPTEYIYPCKNNGDCRKLLYEEQGWNWDTGYPPYGVVHVTEMTVHGFEVTRAGFKCCTQCHLPINQAEATRVNRELGLDIVDVEIDDDFMELLNEFE